MCVVRARGRTARERRDVDATGRIVRSARAQRWGRPVATGPRSHRGTATTTMSTIITLDTVPRSIFESLVSMPVSQHCGNP